MILLRPYQQLQIQKSRESFAKGHRRIIIASPTGSGKSILIAEMVRASYEKGRRIFILTHRTELFRSTLGHISKYQIPVVELRAGHPMPIGDYRVLMCMEKTLWNRIQKQPSRVLPPDIILADEIHFNNFTKIINYFPAAYLIGYSATPQGKHISKIYTDIIQTVDVPDLIDQNFLCRIKAWQMTDDTPDLKSVKQKGGDFDVAELFSHYDKAVRYKGVLDGYKSKVSGLKGIVFCVNVEHTINTHATFQSAGVNAFMVHSHQTPQERDFQVREFEASHDGVMINCGILTVGYDCPSIRFVIQDFATTSLPKFLQTIGRGSRPYPGKELFYVLDYGRNHERHGLWNQPREWSLKPKKDRKQQAAPTKICPGCSALLFARVRNCEYCNHEFDLPTTELREGVLVEIDTNTPVALKGKRVSGLTITEIADLQKSKKYKASYCWRLVRSKGEDALKEYAALFQYKHGWVYSQLQKIEDSGFRDYVIK